MKNLLFLFALVICSCSPEDFIPALDNNLAPDGAIEVIVDGKLMQSVTHTAITTEGPYFGIVIAGLFDASSLDGLAFGVLMGYDNTELDYESFGDCSNEDSGCHFIQYTQNETQDNQIDYTSGDDEGTSTIVHFEILEYRNGGRAKGTFGGVVKEDETGELIEIKEGKFDVILEFE